ncbi:MAG: hypothetical protein ABIH75_00770 [Candidatus Omnitrophota bacterium]
MRLISCLVLIASLCLVANTGFCQGTVIFGFEESVPNWEVPDWCYEKTDYVGESIAVSGKFANEGKTSLEIMANNKQLINFILSYLLLYITHYSFGT